MIYCFVANLSKVAKSMTACRHSNAPFHSRTAKPRRESPSAEVRRRFSESVDGIDAEVQQIFLTLPEDKLDDVFRQYGTVYGSGACAYAKRTLTHWRSGAVEMSGLIAQRLLQIVPTVLEPETRYEWVKRLRRKYMHREHRRVLCPSPMRWFKIVAPEVDALIQRSESFALPGDIIKKVHWMMEGDALAAQALLAAIEVDEANIRRRFLAQEYRQIGCMIKALKGETSVHHTIVLPQGTIEVTIEVPKGRLLRQLRAINEERNDRERRPMAVTCKNAKCAAELETTLRGYEGEPMVCTPSQITCDYCGSTHIYKSDDMHVLTTAPSYDIWKGLFGRRSVNFGCPACGTALTSPIEDAGMLDNCPRCRQQFTVPGAGPRRRVNV